MIDKKLFLERGYTTEATRDKSRLSLFGPSFLATQKGGKTGPLEAGGETF
jgi:hypothetical protein